MTSVRIVIALVLLVALLGGTGTVVAQGISADGCLNAGAVFETPAADNVQTGVEKSNKEGFPNCMERSVKG